MANFLYDYVQNWDRFGATIGLNVARNQEFKTIGGGCISFALQVLISIYFVMQFLAVMNYEDPII